MGDPILTLNFELGAVYAMWKLKGYFFTVGI